MIALRKYQVEMVDGVRTAFSGGARRVLLQAPTGSGKTVIAAHIASRCIARGGTVWFAVHRVELLEQAQVALESYGLAVGRIAACERYQHGLPAYVASIQTLARRQLDDPTLLIVDEAHHGTSPTWRAQILGRKCRVLGLSATPARLDGRGLDGVFDALVLGPTTSELIDSGSLSRYRIYAPSGIDMSGARKSGGDWLMSDAAERASAITGSAVDHYKRLAAGGKAIAYCCNVLHSTETAQRFVDAGIPAVHLDGGASRARRAETIAAFRSGDVRVLCNCELFAEGFDVPDADCAIMLRPTKSLALYLQQAGRVLRPSEGKVAAILDHVGNAAEHGMPCDRRDWSLSSGVVKRQSEFTEQVSICKKCFSAQRPARICSYCGHDMGEVKKRKSPEEVAGELEELKIMRELKTADRKSARTMQELVALGKSRGYKSPVAWAAHVIGGRRR